MKVQQSRYLNPFAGINFVFNYLDQQRFDRLLKTHLPQLAKQSNYQWKDIIYSLFAVFYCGGDCIEDLQTNFKHSLDNNPFLNRPSADTVLKRLKELSLPCIKSKAKRGKINHDFSMNERLAGLNMALLNNYGYFNNNQLIIDYDNTIIFSEKADCQFSYKKAPGYQPGVAFLNASEVLYIENRNGNCGAKILQHETLQRMFDALSIYIKEEQQICFRADSASYQYEVLKELEKQHAQFYIAAKSNSILPYYTEVKNWETTKDKKGEKIDIGEMLYVPFKEHIKKENYKENTYRLIIKRKKREDKQIDIFSKQAYDYYAILTNNTSMSIKEVIDFYDQRGRTENQFDILKNDFGWAKIPFSKLEQNTVFLYLMAICKNIFTPMITLFSKTNKTLKPNFRIKKFIFRFIAIPGKWIKRSRQNILRIYSGIP